MNSILERGLKKVQRESRPFLEKIRKITFPLWFIHPISRKIFFQLYEKLSFSQKEYILSEYIQKPGTLWIRSNFDFEVRFHSKVIKVPIRSEFFAADMGLALCILGLDSPVKYLYYKIFQNSYLRNQLKIVDIGANLGQNLFLFCSHSQNVTAFEPNPNCLGELGRVLEANKFYPRLINAAVGSLEGELLLKWPAGCTWFGTVSETDHLKEMGYCELEQIKVPVVVLDQEISLLNQPTLIKIDVEGNESDVLAGARNLLLRNDCLVVFEQDFSRPQGREKIWSFLNSIGYGLFQIVADASKPLIEVPTMEEYLADHRPNHAAVKRKSEFCFLHK